MDLQRCEQQLCSQTPESCGSGRFLDAVPNESSVAFKLRAALRSQVSLSPADDICLGIKLGTPPPPPGWWLPCEEQHFSSRLETTKQKVPQPVLE